MAPIWDAIVIGAGPAGALAARELALRGLGTLLVDAKRFPRPKVCGGCLNHRAVATLQQAKLQSVLDRLNGVVVDRFRLIAGQHENRFSLPPGLAVHRETLDAQLVEAAVAAGVCFLPETQAIVEPHVDQGGRQVSIGGVARRDQLTARVVLAADGLSRSSLKKLPEFSPRVRPGSRIGVGAVSEDDGSEYPRGEIAMIVSPVGYVGLTRIDPGRLNIAAALDPVVLVHGQHVGDILTTILSTAGMPVPRGMAQAPWQGTPQLTSRPSSVAAERLFVIGDAGGYVEPFTGEGMASAFETALAVVPLAIRAGKQWDQLLARAWESAHHRLVSCQQQTCHALAWTLRRPWAVAATMAICNYFPHAAKRLIARINDSSDQGGSHNVSTT